MKRRIKQKLVAQHPQKYFRFLRPRANAQNQRLAVPLRNRSRERAGSVGKVDRPPSPCACIAKKIIKIEDHRKTWFDNVKAHLDNECYVHETICPRNRVVDNCTPLHNAVREDKEEIVESLLKEKAFVDEKTTYDLTPLHIAVHRGNTKIAEILLNNGASIDSKCTLDEHSWVPLDLAVLGCHTNMVKLLLSRRAKDDGKKNFNWSPPRLFRSNESYESINVYLFMQHLDSGNDNRTTSLLDAVDDSMLEYRTVVRYLLAVCSNFSDTKMVLRELMHYAVERGFFKIVQDFLIWGAEIDIIDYRAYASHIPGMTLLHTAVKHDMNDIAKLLIDHGADVNAEDFIGKSPILYAFEKGNVEIVELLLSKGAHKDGTPDLLLTAVTLSKNSETIEILLKNGSDVNSRDDLERTPLHLAVRQEISSNNFSFVFVPGSDEEYGESSSDRVKIIKLLLRNGADVNARDNNCHTPLHVAAQCGNFRAVETLLEHYAENEEVSSNIDAICEYRATALTLAAEKGNEKVVDILVKFGADINFKREDGKTSLVRATERGHAKVVEVLLKHDADIEAKNYLGLTALDIAFKRLSSFNAVAYTKIIMLLLNRGADINAVNSLNSSMCSCSRTPNFLKQHIVKMKAAGIYVDDNKFESIINSSSLSYFRKVCDEEVERLKIEKIGNSIISFYDIVTKSTNRLATICRNSDIVEALETESYKEHFPIYSLMIENNFKRGLKRESLLDRALRSFNCLIGREFLDVLSADMLKYLPNEDLKNLEQASTL